MGTVARRLERRRKAIAKLALFFEQPDLANVIHYSCESFYDRPQGTSPRITSIAVRNIGSGQTTSFSIHQVAERQHVAFDQITARYDELEKQMLDQFYKYVDRNSKHKWMHWNMRDINYGFPALDHRGRVLDVKTANFRDDQLIDLAACLVDIYGPGYVSHPRLEKVLELNRISVLHFLSGADEAKAFVLGEYVKLHQSTLKKVDVISHLAERQWDGSLLTLSRPAQQYGAEVVGVIEIVTEHWAYKILGFVGILASVVGIPLALMSHH